MRQHRRKKSLPPRHVLLVTAGATALRLPLPPIAQRDPASPPTVAVEQCDEIAKAGRTDCHTAQSSCAGTAQRDRHGEAWRYVPAGTCSNIVGGSLTPKKSEVPRPLADSISVSERERDTLSMPVTRYSKGRRYDTMLFTSSTPYNRACWQEEQQP